MLTILLLTSFSRRRILRDAMGNYIVYRAKESVRHGLREILLFCAAGPVFAAVLLDSPRAEKPSLAMVSVIVGVPAGLLLWLLYRLVRFALGK
jgi:hypothetical protein